MEKLILSESFKEMIERNKEQSRICKFLSMADKLPLSIRGNGINYLTTRQNGILSYLPKGKEIKFTDDGKWSREGRQEGRASAITSVFSPRVMSKILTKDIEIFTNIIKGFESTAEYTIVKGYDLSSVYDEKSSIHAVSSSCMQDKSGFEDSNGDYISYVSLYADNPDRVEMIVFRDDEGKLIGRALKWLTDCGSIVIDRVYATEEITERINDICYENFWYKKQYNNYQYKQNFIYQGQCVIKQFAISLLNNSAPCIPYMDCFSYLEPLEQGGAILRNYYAVDVVFNICSNVDGCFTDIDLKFCKYLDSCRKKSGFKFSEFYGHDVYKQECRTTDKGLIYEHHIEHKERLIYKGRKYEQYTCVDLFRLDKGAKFNKAQLIERSFLSRSYGFKLPNGRIIESSLDTSTEGYMVATHPESKERIKVMRK